MANRIFYKLEDLNKEKMLVCGFFSPQGVSAPTIPAVQVARGYSVTRTGVGAYLLTLDQSWPPISSADASLQLSAPAAQKILVGAITPNTVVLTNVNTNTGAATEIAANASNNVHFRLSFNNTLIPGG